MTIRSYVKIKPLKDDGAFSANFNEIRKGINRTGEVVENIGSNLVETHKLIRFEKEWLRDDQKREVKEDKVEAKEKLSTFQKWSKGFKNMFRLKQREELAEDPNDKQEGDELAPEESAKVKVMGKAMGWLKSLANFLMPIFKFFLLRAMLKWSSDPENAKRLNKVFRLVVAIGKFAWNIGKFGVGLIVSGLNNVFGAFENGDGPIKKGFSFLFGAFKLFAGFKTLQYLLNPLKIFTDGKRLLGLFNNVNDKEVEFKKNEQWRKFGYKDKETGKIYTEQEYKAQKKSVERQQRKLRAQGKNAQADKVGKGFNNRIKNPTRLQKGKNIGKGLMKPGAQKGLAVVGGISRIASGIAMGEDKTQAVGAGIGQAAGGMIGAAAGTALLGPFLGPFAPIVGNAIGGFLGEWVGKTFLPMIKPIFEPIQKMFKMLGTVVTDIAGQTGITEFLGTFFQFVGELGKVLFNVLGWIMKPITWLLGGAIKVLGGVIGFIINSAKKIWAIISTPGKVIRQIIWDRSLKNVGNDIELEDVGSNSVGGPVKTPEKRMRGGILPMRKEPDIIQRMRGGSVANITNNNIEYAAGGKVIKQMFATGGDVTTNISNTVNNTKEKWNPTVGRLSQTIPQGPDFDMQSVSDKRDMVMKRIQEKQRRDTQMDDLMILPPKLIVQNNTQKVINNVGSAPAKAVYVSPSPMFTC